MARKFAAVVFSLGCIQTSAVMALGLGEMTLGSYLNEPLRAQVDLLNIGGLHEDQIKVRLATSDDFKKMGVDRAYFLTSLTFDVEIDENGRARIIVTSEDPVLEPYLDLIVEARWPSGRLLREYTVLVDPPVFDQSNPIVSASTRVAEVDGVPEPAKKKPQVIAATGTRVDIRDSQLAPGEMPARAFNSSASPSAVPGARYMIHQDDTLWRIASSARPAGASVHQTMLEIQRLNPDAFIGGNINRIKAGFIIYLPDDADITSGDKSQAVAEVRQQNQAWREGRSAEPGYGSGPSLRISAEPEEAPAPSAPQSQPVASPAALESMEKAGLDRVELEQRLASMEQQLETLQRIVALKDDQIAALQGVIAQDGDTAITERGADSGAELAEPGDMTVVEEAAVDVEVSAVEEVSGEETAALVVEESVAEAPLQQRLPVEDSSRDESFSSVEGSSSVEDSSSAEGSSSVEDSATAEAPGVFSYLWYLLGAAALAIGGILYMRRRSAAQEYAEDDAEEDVFADVQLTEQVLEVEDADQPPAPPVVKPEPVRPEPALKPEAEPTATPADASKESRGYGQRKHDQYASDEASDALAEAEIYIAYGRYPQAIDLLQNALRTDSNNNAYRLKLLQLYLETGNRTAAIKAMAELESGGDASAIARAKASMAGSEESVARQDFATEGSQTEEEFLSDFDDTLESDFSGLEIEEADILPGELDDELDLSADFDEAELASGRQEEDLVIAAEGNGMSTKLDLARAYMDMGDDDGARQILEEVAAEGNEELQAEARALLERIG